MRYGRQVYCALCLVVGIAMQQYAQAEELDVRALIEKLFSASTTELQLG
jgi:hypothetical protein